MTEDGQEERASSGTGVLLIARFILELWLLTAFVGIGIGLVDGPLGWLLAAVLVLAAMVVWGLFVAPKRRVDSPLAVRIVIELALFVAAALGLAAIGHPLWGVILLVAELVVLGLLRRPGEHPPGAAFDPNG